MPRIRTRSPFRLALAAELAGRDLTHVMLAHLLGVAPSTLAGWLNEVYPEPPDLRDRIEKKLGLGARTLPRDEKTARASTEKTAPAITVSAKGVR